MSGGVFLDRCALETGCREGGGGIDTSGFLCCLMFVCFKGVGGGRK